jgi:hypothetical protein
MKVAEKKPTLSKQGGKANFVKTRWQKGSQRCQDKAAEKKST